MSHGLIICADVVFYELHETLLDGFEPHENINLKIIWVYKVNNNCDEDESKNKFRFLKFCYL